MKIDKRKKALSVDSWYHDIQLKGSFLAEIPENEKTLEMCFVAIHYWGAALEFVPEELKTYELCLDAIRHNTPVDEGCSALAFVPEKLKTYDLCLEAIRHDYLISIFWDLGETVQSDYIPAINYVPKNIRTPELCFEALIHYPSSPPGFFDFIEPGFGHSGVISVISVKPETIQDILKSVEFFVQSLKRVGMPDKYEKDAVIFYEKIVK